MALPRRVEAVASCRLFIIEYFRRSGATTPEKLEVTSSGCGVDADPIPFPPPSRPFPVPSQEIGWEERLRNDLGLFIFIYFY